MILLQKEQVTAEHLAKQFEVSVRTIYRDIDTINIAGIPIVSTPGVGGGICIMEQYKLEKGIFSKADLIQILRGTDVFSAFLPKEEIATTKAKIESLVPDTLKQEINTKVQQISFDESSRYNKKLKKKIQLLHQATQLQYVVNFFYWSAKAEETQREVEPAQLLFQHGHWYMQGYCRDKKAFRVFKLSRMWDIEMTKIIFEPKISPSAMEEFNTNMTNKAIVVELQVHSSVLDRIMDFCDRKDIHLLKDGTYHVKMDFIPNNYDYGLLLSLGEHCVCLAPDFVRNELYRKANAISQNYSN